LTIPPFLFKVIKHGNHSPNDAAPTPRRTKQGDEIMKRQSIFFAFALAATAATLAAAATPHAPTGLAVATPNSQSPATAKVTFRGTEYLLRSLDGKTYEFTPPGQEDLSAFTDMLALNLFPTAHDQEALDTITSRTLAIAQGAKATILRTISVSASGQQPGEHFFAAVVPTPHDVDFDATRFVLVDKQVVGVYYTHRSYGQSAAATASAWATKNVADVEQQLLHFDASRMVSAAKISTSPSLPTPNTDLPAGTIKKGTLTSPQLKQDTMLGVAGKMGALGCHKTDDVAPYVVTPFSGAPGARQWQERWLVTGCGKQFPIDIDFKEDGAGGAYWTIKK
jgi:hypothetical protein